MTAELDTIISTLHSDEARLAFLNNIYVPGNRDVADRILSLNEDSSIVTKEIAHAREVGDIDRLREMGRSHIDYHVRHNFDILLRDVVMGWQDVELADYAIEQMTSKPEEDRKLEGPLKYASEIAESFGKPELARSLLERLLKLQERDAEYKFPAAQTLKELGRFDEAIDKYLEASWIRNAFNLAQEHVPTRVAEVAKIGFKDYKPGKGSAEFYLECAEVLGETRKAEKTLVKYAKRTKIEHSPRCYAGVVKSLVKLGRDEEARNLVRRVAAHEEEVKSSDRHFDFERPHEMANLYHAIGEIDAVRDIYADRIDRRIKERHHPSNALNDIKKAIELTGDQSFREKELGILERQKEYQKAASLATELGKPELAATYSTMHQMVAQVKAE